MQSSILDLNNDELYAVFDLVVQEMNYRKSKDLLEVQRQMRIEKAKEKDRRLFGDQVIEDIELLHAADINSK